MHTFNRSSVGGELDLLPLCPDPSLWGEINGEPRKVRRISLRSLLSRNGYSLTRLQFRISTTEGYKSYWNRSFLYGECISSEGKTFCFNISPLYKWDINDQKELDYIKIGHDDGYDYYHPEDALLRFEQKDGIVAGVYYLSVQTTAYPDAEYPKNQLKWNIVPHGYYSKYTDNIVYGAPE